MDLGLRGKRTLVPESSSGIGEGIARMLTNEGCEVVVHGRNEGRIRAVARAICAVAWTLGDLAGPRAAEAAAGEVDIL